LSTLGLYWKFDLYRILIYTRFWFIQDFDLYKILIETGFWFIQDFGLFKILIYTRFWFIQDFDLYKILVYSGFGLTVLESLNRVIRLPEWYVYQSDTSTTMIYTFTLCLWLYSTASYMTRNIHVYHILVDNIAKILPCDKLWVLSRIIRGIMFISPSFTRMVQAGW
jgi:hypothetical protein